MQPLDYLRRIAAVWLLLGANAAVGLSEAHCHRVAKDA